MDPIDIDSESPRGTKRKADELSVVTAPRRIKVQLSPIFTGQILIFHRLLIQMSSTKLPLERSSSLLFML